MRTDPNDQASIVLLHLQARMFSESLVWAKDEWTKLFAGMRSTVRALEGSMDPRVVEVAGEMRALIDSTERDLLRALDSQFPGPDTIGNV